MSGGEGGEAWPPLDATLAAPGMVLRTPSVISTIYGDAILPRGGALALADLLALMRRLGATEGMVRTAVSRLARDGVLAGGRAGRHSFYALTNTARAEFAAAVPRIYGPEAADWDGALHLAFPDPGMDRSALESAGFALLAPGVLLGAQPAPPGVPALASVAPPHTAHRLAARAWPLAETRQRYELFMATVRPLEGAMPPEPLAAMAGRIALIHAFRRVALRDPHLPGRLLPADWPGHAARGLCQSIYANLAPASERWLDGAGSGSGPLASGPDPLLRFVASGGGTRPSAPASSPAPAGSRRRARSTRT